MHKQRPVSQVDSFGHVLACIVATCVFFHQDFANPSSAKQPRARRPPIPHKHSWHRRTHGAEFAEYDSKRNKHLEQKPKPVSIQRFVRVPSIPLASRLWYVTRFGKSYTPTFRKDESEPCLWSPLQKPFLGRHQINTSLCLDCLDLLEAADVVEQDIQNDWIFQKQPQMGLTIVGSGLNMRF